MAQRKSPSEVGLLTPANLREIRAAVLRWVRDNPANIRAMMEQAREMLESIIRYRLREKLDLATPKPPVLGGIGVAYGPYDFDFGCVAFLESGWVYLPIDENVGAVYQTEEVKISTELDYFTISDTSFEYDVSRSSGYSDGMESIAFPPSVKRSFHTGNRSAQTGKLKLLFQSIMGSDDADLAAIASVFKEKNTKEESYGLYSSPSSFEHWLVRIKDNKISLAKLEYSQCGEELKLVLGANYTPRSERETKAVKMESYLFTMIASADNWVDIATYASFTGDPIEYGFNFNWDGTQAVMVCHEKVFNAGSPDYIVSRTYKLEISGETSASITMTNNGLWTPVFNKANLWGQEATGLEKMEFWYPCNCCSSWASGDQYGDVSIYQWYYDDGELGELTYYLAEQTVTPNIAVARNTWLASLQECGTMGANNIWFSGPANQQGFFIKKNGSQVIDATGFNAISGLRISVSVDITVTRTDTTYCRKKPSNIESMCDWDKVEFSWNSCQLSDCDSSNTRAIKKECGSVFYERKELYFTSITSQSIAIFPFNSPESVFIGVDQRFVGQYTHNTKSNTGFVGYKAYAAIGPQPCTFTLMNEGQLITPANDQAKDAIGCNWTPTVTVDPYENDPFTEEYLKYYLIPPNKEPILIEDEYWENLGGQLNLTGYGYLFNPIVCGPNPIPYYSLKIKNDESAGYRDRFYYGSLLTGTAVHVAETDVPAAYSHAGLWGGWV